ncbi:MAG: Rrf2 family transcriptional regulator [Lactococcus lactis]|nr:Rrf2 family transcriptional regulator [Lactococcus lactis]
MMRISLFLLRISLFVIQNIVSGQLLWYNINNEFIVIRDISYLKKIIKSLVDEGLLRSTTGKNGGFSLNKDLLDISFYDVFLAIEGRGRIFQSQGLLQNFIGAESGKAQHCAITTALDEIENTLVRTLSNVSLAQVADETQYNYNLGYLDEWIDEMD